MKVYIQTLYRGNNYGSVLQAYALQEAISSWGYDCEILAYAPTKYTQWKLKILHHGVKATIDYKVNEMAMKFAKGGEKQGINNLELFERFRQTQMRITKPCSDKKSIYNICGNHSVFVCGSDQIWTPYNFNPAYFLNFVSDPRYKIAYAPSFGVDVMSQYSTKQIAKELRSFSWLSVREEKGAELIKELTGQEAKVVADPTMLLPLSSWDRIQTTLMQQKPYLFCYFLGKNSAYYGIAQKIAKRFGLQIRMLPMIASDFERQETIKESVGPSEWLSLVKNAAFVLTDSFHCTLFSIRYHRQFYVLQRFDDGDKRSQNSRIRTLLNLTEFSDRLLAPDDSHAYNLIEPARFDTSDRNMASQIQMSESWLKNALDQAVKQKESF